MKIKELFKITKEKNTKKLPKYVLTTRKICLLSFYICILIVAKFKFGINIDGIEVVTSLFILSTLVFNIYECILLVISFNMLCFAIYGFGVWWITYWAIWPIEIGLTLLLRKYLFYNNITAALWAGVLGFSILGFYFFSDLIFLGKSAAYANVITAVPVNLIEAATNFIFTLVFFIPFTMLLNKLHMLHSPDKITWFVMYKKKIMLEVKNAKVIEKNNKF